MLQWFLARAAEPSTWAGLAGIAGSVGISQPVYAAASSVVVAIFGLIAVVLKEQHKA